MYINKKERHIMKTKTIENKHLQFKSDEIDGQEWETVYILIYGNRFIADARFMNAIDRAPSNHMENIIAKQPTLYNHMFPEENGINSEFAKEGIA